VYSCTHWLRPRNSPPPPAFGLIYEGAIGQPRQTTSLCKPLGQNDKTREIGDGKGVGGQVEISAHVGWVGGAGDNVVLSVDERCGGGHTIPALNGTGCINPY
jgi:hypothetical protein